MTNLEKFNFETPSDLQQEISKSTSKFVNQSQFSKNNSNFVNTPTHVMYNVLEYNLVAHNKVGPPMNKYCFNLTF
jgi:hypothetical protein